MCISSEKRYRQVWKRRSRVLAVVSPVSPPQASADHDLENRAYALMFLANGVTTVQNMWELCPRTFCTFSRELSSCLGDSSEGPRGRVERDHRSDRSRERD